MEEGERFRKPLRSCVRALAASFLPPSLRWLQSLSRGFRWRCSRRTKEGNVDDSDAKRQRQTHTKSRAAYVFAQRRNDFDRAAEWLFYKVNQRER